MLSRVLEPELMDSAAEAEAYNAMDHADVDQRFIDDLLAAASSHPEVGGQRRELSLVVDLGAGTALQPIRLCDCCPSVRVVAVDAAAAMFAVAQRNLRAAGSERVELLLADVKHLPFADGTFDIVCSNSLMHHLPHPVDAVRAAWRVLAPGGRVFFRDLIRPATRGDVDALVKRYVAAADVVGRRLFAESLAAALTVEEVAAGLKAAGVPSTVRTTSDRHWTWSATKPL